MVIRRPYLIGDQIAAENQKLERQLKDGQVRVDHQREELASLQTPQGMEREARRLGYLKPNEVPLFIPPK